MDTDLAFTRSLGPLPPCRQFDRFLADRERRALLDWAIAHESAFEPAKVFYGEHGSLSRVAPDRRNALKHHGVKQFEPLLRQRLLKSWPEISAAAGYNGPEPTSIEFELNAYGNGGRFAPHIDIPIGRSRVSTGEQEGEDRVVSAVCYFHSEPKAFSGGTLRLYRFGADPRTAGPGDSIVFEPQQDSLVVFPSWAMHEVETVQCASERFGDFRFGLNCWFCRQRSV
jgi:hypothetical protein